MCGIRVGPSRRPAEVEKGKIPSLRTTVFCTGQLVVVLTSAMNLIGDINLALHLMYVQNFLIFVLAFHYAFYLLERQLIINMFQNTNILKTEQAFL